MFARAWFGLWIWLVYALRLRRPLNRLLRWLVDGDAARAPLPRFTFPADVAKHLLRYEWRKDGTRIGGLFVPLDFVSSPEVTQARIEDRTRVDGDCDDAHHLAAVLLEGMPRVDAAYHVCIGYRGGGHMACVYRFQGSWWLMNYAHVLSLESPKHAERALLHWASKWRGEDVGPSRWFFFETTSFERVAL